MKRLEIKVDKYQTIKNDIAGEVHFDISIEEPNGLINMMKYFRLSKQEVEKLIEVLQNAIK